MQELEKIWMTGELVDWADAKIHVGSHGLHYGSGVFEGIRAYETPKGSAVFRLTDHLERLHNSARVLVDRNLLSLRIVWLQAGSPRHVLGVRPRQLLRLTRAETGMFLVED